MPGVDVYTSVMLHCDGTNNSTAALTNSSTGSAASVPLAGNGKLTTTTQQFGSASVSFDGTAGTYAGVNIDSSIFPSGDFTIDFWTNFNATTSGQASFSITDITNVGYGACIGILLSSASFQFFSGSSNTVWDIANGQIWGTASSGNWIHWAVTRQSSIWRLFQAGTLNTTFFSTLTPYRSSINEPLLLAAQAYNGAGNTINFMNGFIDEFRISNGVARWTTSFTVPATPYDQWEPGFDAKSDDWRRPTARMMGY